MAISGLSAVICSWTSGIAERIVRQPPRLAHIIPNFPRAAAQPRANPVFAAHSVSSRRAPHLQAESRQTNPNGGAPPVIRAVLAELGEITIGTGMLGMLVIFVYQG